jgi:hypothetical protein
MVQSSSISLLKKEAKNKLLKKEFSGLFFGASRNNKTEEKVMQRMIARIVNAVALRAGVRNDAAARAERIIVHLLFMLVADRWLLVVRSAAGIVREIQG